MFDGKILVISKIANFKNALPQPVLWQGKSCDQKNIAKENFLDSSSK